MNEIFTNYFENIMEVLMDDLAIYGTSFDNFLYNLNKVLQECEESGFMWNWEKCHFMIKESTILGHKVSEGKIKIDHELINIIERMSYLVT